MFVQVIEGKVADEELVRGQLAAWMVDLQPGADGWLGTTAGFAADGSFIAVARFESEEAARANSGRPEQGAWWEATAPAFDGEVAFADCRDVDTFGDGGSDDAGFVQVMTGHGDRAAILPVADDITAMLRRMRPDVIGGTVAWAGEGRFIQTVYFTSEGEARAAEGADPVTEEDQAARERLMSLLQVERYIDILEPLLYSV